MDVTFCRDFKEFISECPSSPYVHYFLQFVRTYRSIGLPLRTMRLQKSTHVGGDYIRDMHSFTVPPKIMPLPPLTNLLEEGNRAGITCQVVEGDLPINFRWEKSTPSGRSVELGAVPRRIDEYLSLIHISEPTRPY